jgi:hypothetical protein
MTGAAQILLNSFSLLQQYIQKKFNFVQECYDTSQYETLHNQPPPPPQWNSIFLQNSSGITVLKMTSVAKNVFLFIKVKLSLCLIKHHATNIYGGSVVQLHTFLTLVLDGSSYCYENKKKKVQVKYSNVKTVNSKAQPHTPPKCMLYTIL